MFKKKVSILVPVYNVSHYIERCAESLFKQSYDNIEFIFVNDCTPDNSIEILRSVIEKYEHLKDRICIVNHERNRGLAAARNTALMHAQGDYILHVDSDDYLNKDTVKKLYRAAVDFEADLVISNFMFEYKTKKKINVNNFYEDKINYITSLLTRKSLVNIIGMLIKRSVLIENNLWEIEGLNQGEDYLMTPRIAYFSEKIVKVDDALYNYNRTNISSYTANINEKAVNDIITVQDKLIAFFREVNDSELFQNAVEQSCIYNKLTLLYCAPYSTYERIVRLYKDINWKKYKHTLKTKQKIIFKLLDFGLNRIVYVLIKIGKIFRS